MRAGTGGRRRVRSLGRSVAAGAALVVLTTFGPAAQADAGAMPADLGIEEISAGSGAVTGPDSVVELHYTGRLANGTVFNSTYGRGRPIRFQLGTGRVIPGWELGMLGLREGGKRTLVIPPRLAYGAAGVPNVIPPGETLTIEVELLAVSEPAWENIGTDVAAQRMRDGVTVIDIRRQDEWRETGVVEGSVLLTAFDTRGRLVPGFLDELARLVDPDQPVVFLCRTGARTAAISQLLTERLGYTRVASVNQGIMRWLDEQRPVVTAQR